MTGSVVGCGRTSRDTDPGLCCDVELDWMRLELAGMRRSRLLTGGLARALALEAARKEGGQSRESVSACVSDVPALPTACLRLITSSRGRAPISLSSAQTASTAAHHPLHPSRQLSTQHRAAPSAASPVAQISRLALSISNPFPPHTMSSRQCLRLAAGSSMRPAVRAAPRYASRSAAALRCLSTSSVSRSSILLSKQPR